MMIIRAVVGAVAAASLLAGCGGGSEDAASKTTTAASSSAAPQATLKEICPQVEAQLNKASIVPSKAKLKEIRAAIVKLRASGDLEAKNALTPYIASLDEAYAAYDSGELLPKLGVSEAYDKGISALSTRCKAVGSSAFQ